MKRNAKKWIVQIFIGMIISINLIGCGNGSSAKAVDSAMEQVNSVNKVAYGLKDIRATYDESSKTFSIYPIFDEELIYAAAGEYGQGDDADVFLALFKGQIRGKLREELVEPIQEKYLDKAGITVEIVTE